LHHDWQYLAFPYHDVGFHLACCAR
jgi:hypothetical protein